MLVPPLKPITALLICIVLSSCSAIIDKQTAKFTQNLSDTVLNFEDPETVKTATPTFLILIDSMAKGENASAEAKLSAAQMFGSFAGAFVSDPKRQKILSRKALDYAREGSCKTDKKFCKIEKLSSAEFKAFSQSLERKDLAASYALAVAWLGYIQTHADDWAVIADLAKAQLLLERILILDESYDNAGPHLYMGAIASTLPPALGGKPEVAKMHFEKGIALTQGKSLLIKVEYARRYARSVFDKELHHQLLSEVIQADPIVDGLTLMNSWAQQQAILLLADENEYFD